MADPLSLAEALTHCREDRVFELLEARLASGVSPVDIVAECNAGMVALGDRFADGDCFIPELMLGGRIMKSIVGRLGPLMEPAAANRAIGRAVIGTVRHDVHDIGKDLLVLLLRGVGFEVVDLGVDVAPEAFAAAVERHRPTVLGLSLLLTTCAASVAATIDALRRGGLRDKVAVMLGGGAATQGLADTTGCDYYGRTVADGMRYACRLAGVGG